MQLTAAEEIIEQTNFPHMKQMREQWIFPQAVAGYICFFPEVFTKAEYAWAKMYVKTATKYLRREERKQKRLEEKRELEENFNRGI
jgi:hypothetical protein